MDAIYNTCLGQQKWCETWFFGTWPPMGFL